MNGLRHAVALTLFALTGFENATAPVDKVRNPSRTIPLALLGGTLFVVLLYLASSSAVLSLLGTQAVAASTSPFADAIAREWGRGASWLAITAIAVAAFGGLNGMILATSELGYSMALRGDLPRRIARTRGAGTPVASVWLSLRHHDSAVSQTPAATRPASLRSSSSFRPLRCWWSTLSDHSRLGSVPPCI